MEIIKINLPALRNEEHFQFLTDVKDLIQAADLQSINIEPIISFFIELLNKEDIALKTIRKNVLTDPITDADALRDMIYRGFILFTEAHLYSPQAKKMKAAYSILEVIEHYGDFRNKSYNEETSLILSFLQDIKKCCSGDISALNAGEWINQLTEANQTFEVLMNKYLDQNAGHEIVNLRQIRKSVNSTYSQIINSINAYVLLNSSNAYDEFTGRINDRVASFKKTLVQRKGRVVAKKENLNLEQFYF